MDLQVVRTLHDARQKLSRQSYDLIIADLRLPDSTQPNETVGLLERQAGGTPILVLSGAAGESFLTAALHVDDVYGLLADQGYLFSSSVLAAERGGVPYRTEEGIWEIPVSPCPCHPLGVFDTWHSLGKRGASHKGEGELAGLFARLLASVVADGGLANIYLDPKEAVESGELERMLRLLAEADIEVVDYGGIVARVEATAGAIPAAMREE